MAGNITENELSVSVEWISMSLYIIKRFRRRRRVKNREGEGGGGGRIILSPPNAGLF